MTIHKRTLSTRLMSRIRKHKFNTGKNSECIIMKQLFEKVSGIIQGSHSYLESGKTGNFVLIFSRPGKPWKRAFLVSKPGICLENASYDCITLQAVKTVEALHIWIVYFSSFLWELAKRYCFFLQWIEKVFMHLPLVRCFLISFILKIGFSSLENLEKGLEFEHGKGVGTLYLV